MIYQHQQPLSARRKGVILLVVISLLTLFAIVGISFVLYANAAANASKIFRDAAAQSQPDMDPELLLNLFITQLLYDVPDDASGVYSALRGHSLGRSQYGQPFLTLQANIVQGQQTVILTSPASNLSAGMKVFGPGIATGTIVLAVANPPMQFTISQPAQATASVNLGFSLPATTPFNGTGRLHTSGTSAMNPYADDYQLINYTYYPSDPNAFIRYPEALTLNNGMPGGVVYTNGSTNPPSPPLPPMSLSYTGGANAPYTYPDLNNMFLAAVKADGTVLTQSFHRSWTGFGSLDPSNPNWFDTTQPQLKYMVMRPRPADQLLAGETWPPNRPYFPPPEDAGGDVKNFPGPGYLNPLTGVNANNDSVWIDLNAPVMVAPDGTKFKALFAPLIIDLDGRVNLNVAGNIRGLEGQPRPISPGSVALGAAHRSNQGWGPWEVNLESIFSFSSTGIAEWPNLFLGNGVTSGRYGGDQIVTSANNSSVPGTPPHINGQVDFDGSNEMGGYTATAAIQLPQAGGPSTSFPSFPQGVAATAYGQNGYGNGTGGAPGTERWQHPLLYNYFQPAGDDRMFPISNMEALLRYGDTNSPALTSDFFRLCPNNFMFPNDPRTRTDGSKWFARNLLTTISFDVDTPGVAPWAIPPTPGGPGTSNYTLPAAPGLFPPPPRGPAANFPPLNARGQASGEFSSVDWRAINAALGRVNLNRYLTPYQNFNGVSWAPGNIQQATTDRQQFAADIFLRLVSVTGAYDFINNPTIANQQQFDALRWLAQLAANIVDYIDSDDVMTPFPWALVTLPGGGSNPAYQTYPQLQAIQQFQQWMTANPNTADPTGQGWVFGAELPRVVINEAYAEYTVTSPTPPNPIPKTGGNFTVKVDVWAELHNPFNADPLQADPNQGQANLAAYQLILANASNPPPGTQPINSSYLRQAINTIGSIPQAVQYSAPISLAGNTIPPCNGQANTGFFVVAPQQPAGKPGPSIPINPGTSLQSPNMSYQPPAIPGMPSQTKPSPPPPAPTIVLQRLANPLLQANPAPNQPLNPGLPYNPYVTVDYFEGGASSQPPTAPNPAIQWTVQDSTKDSTNPNPNIAYGRAEPYAGYGGSGLVVPQTGQPTPNQPKNSFYQVNQPTGQPAGQPFHWLAHLDRQVISPMELLQVSGYKPHELTQQFIFPTGGTLQNYQHRAPWFDEDLASSPGSNSHFLYRLFEFLETGNRAAGMTPGGRVPGKVNINTIWDPEILLALADAQLGNSNAFDSNAIYNAVASTGIWTTLLSQRSTQIAPGLYAPGQTDRPFWSLAAGTYPPGDAQFQALDNNNPPNPISFGINNTLLRSGTVGGAGNTPRLFQGTVGGTAPSHPYLQDELLTKIFNNLTTRSNVFAVFVTVGFFQVIDDTSRPVKLGAEIGRAENRHIRHRMFAIVDRTNLATDKFNPNTIQPPPVYLVGSVPYPPPPAPPTPNTIAIPDGQLAAGGAGLLLTGTYEGIRWIIQPPSPGAFPTLGSNVVIDSGTNQEIVNVVAVNPASPPTIQTTPWTKAHAGPIAVTPVNTVTAYTQIQAGTGTPTTPVQIAVSAVNGQFQGVNWNFQVGTIILLDAGSSVPGTTPEPALIVSPPPVPPAQGQSGSITIQSLNAGGFQVHRPGPSGGYTISYPIPVGGNPGPQTNFDMRQVPWVVRHFSIIN
jgi:hypothetical protein